MAQAADMSAAAKADARRVHFIESVFTSKSMTVDYTIFKTL